MKALLLLVGCMVILSGLAGCQSGGKAVEVIIAGDGQFPSCLAGTWKADYGWQITFEDDGDISSSVIALGAVRITPGETSVVPMKLGGEGVYEPGTWIVQYDPEDRSLNVEVVIKAFRAELGDDILEGTTIDDRDFHPRNHGRDRPAPVPGQPPANKRSRRKRQPQNIQKCRRTVYRTT